MVEVLDVSERGSVSETKKVRGIAEHRDTVMKIRIKGTSVLDGDISAPFYNSALRTLATRLAPCPP